MEIDGVNSDILGLDCARGRFGTGCGRRRFNYDWHILSDIQTFLEIQDEDCVGLTVSIGLDPRLTLHGFVHNTVHGNGVFARRELSGLPTDTARAENQPVTCQSRLGIGAALGVRDHPDTIVIVPFRKGETADAGRKSH
ncbi:hypothetical protein [Corynebacterium sp. ACRQP]|uniref:hypothetical protein n=1 Tax=Corynebacterium sp. ACRQP TaxID=2918195 RepID=UPI001EF4A79D|nr:hypothetical protein [Corynebacterium sp. ACRQP]MCG7235762.1 hypothetical protein [Corynebacterium sp. ACRQP]